jgi:hypothetical protein
MKKKLTRIDQQAKRLFTLLITALLPFIPIVAAPEDHGRWYSLDDSSSSSHSPAFYVFWFIISAICCCFLIVTILNDDRHSNSDKGCLTVFFLALLAIGFMVVMKECS